MPRWAQKELTGWGRVHRAQTEAARPERAADLAGIVGEARSLIAHGAGRSYGDAALNNGGRTVLTSRLDRFLGFDEATGDLDVEAGVSFTDVIKTFLPRGFMRGHFSESGDALRLLRMCLGEFSDLGLQGG